MLLAYYSSSATHVSSLIFFYFQLSFFAFFLIGSLHPFKFLLFHFLLIFILRLILPNSFSCIFLIIKPYVIRTCCTYCDKDRGCPNTMVRLQLRIWPRSYCRDGIFMCMCVYVCVCVWERESMCVWERESMCVCERESMCVCERERVCLDAEIFCYGWIFDGVM